LSLKAEIEIETVCFGDTSKLDRIQTRFPQKPNPGASQRRESRLRVRVVNIGHFPRGDASKDFAHLA
jgi:hypothetical protein